MENPALGGNQQAEGSALAISPVSMILAVVPCPASAARRSAVARQTSASGTRNRAGSPCGPSAWSRLRRPHPCVPSPRPRDTSGRRSARPPAAPPARPPGRRHPSRRPRRGYAGRGLSPAGSQPHLEEKAGGHGSDQGEEDTEEEDRRLDQGEDGDRRTAARLCGMISATSYTRFYGFICQPSYAADEARRTPVQHSSVRKDIVAVISSKSGRL